LRERVLYSFVSVVNEKYFIFDDDEMFRFSKINKFGVPFGFLPKRTKAQKVSRDFFSRNLYV
jgi:hypothetical protein